MGVAVDLRNALMFTEHEMFTEDRKGVTVT